MVTVSSPPPQLSNASIMEADEVDVGRMDGLLEKLKTSMVELILQGDDVTRQMWHMYSVFEEIFGRQTMTTSSNQPLKHVVVGDKIKSSSTAPSKHKNPERNTPTSPVVPSPVSRVTASSVPSSTAVVATSTTTTLSSPTNSTISASSLKDVKTVSSESNLSSTSPQHKAPKLTPVPSQVTSAKSNVPSLDRTPESPKVQPGPLPTRCLQDSSPSNGSPLTTVVSAINPTSNPLLDTIGVLANSNPDSDDSDLDIVYQQLRYRGRQRKPEQMRIRTHRAHRHHHQQVASSDPESIGYAGSNSIDSGYKSLCATPEVSDSLSAPEVRRSASDVSASDSSTTSGRPRSLDGQDGKSSKIKMGTRSITGKLKAMDRSPRHVPTSAAMSDVNLDHLMYLRQSLRKDRPDMQRSPNDSIPSSATSSTFRDSDLSPRTITDEDWRDQCRPYPFRSATSSSSDSMFTARDGRSSRGSSRGEEIDQEGGGESSSDFLLSGVEYYDLESIQEFPPSNNYVTMLEEKTRCARFQLVSASKRAEPLSESHLSSLYRKRSEPVHPVESDLRSQQQQHIYGIPAQPPRSARNAAKLLSRHHRQQHHATDSKLTEAAIRVLEMIEDFRMEEAITRSNRAIPYRASVEHPSQMIPSSSGATSNCPSAEIFHQTILPRYRRTAGMRSAARPASTGSLMEQEIDARSVASASSYAASAEHHVYEEITYDLVCERERAVPPPIPPERIVRSRLLPVPPSRHQQAYATSMSMDPRRAMVRSHKHRSSSLYSVLSNSHGRNSVDRFLEMEWHLAQERRGNMPPDFPV